MAKLVGCYAAGHAPNIARTWETMDQKDRAWIDEKFGELGVRVKAARPDVLIVHSTITGAIFSSTTSRLSASASATNTKDRPSRS